MNYNKTLEEVLKQFDEKFLKVQYAENIQENQTHQTYPCYISNFQEECIKEFLTTFAEKIREGMVEVEEELFTKIEYQNGVAGGAWVSWGDIKNLLAQLKNTPTNRRLVTNNKYERNISKNNRYL